ncbi:IS30 family transposase [Microbacteriaceae bacterium VKM Ac-2855]|nr:IS30 family transposase [Microbacteriaceae bacterium VKM Ac-2855]
MVLLPLESEDQDGRFLTYANRINIQSYWAQGWSVTRIAAEIGRHKSTVSRELRRNANLDGTYRANAAQLRAQKARRRPRPVKFVVNRVLAELVEGWLVDGWSPALISHVLRTDFADDVSMQVSHETIYRALYVQTRGGLRADLAKQLSTRRSSRRTRGDSRGKAIYRDAFTIRDRPAEAEDRAVPGHWEGDLILGSGNTSAIGTLVERSTRFTILLHLPGDHTADTVAAAMIASMGELPEHLRRSLTWDRGSEMAKWKNIELELEGTKVFFCDPHSPWQRGSNENTNRLLRHWFEKGTDLSDHTPAELRRVQDLLNKRPRPTLDYQTPAQRMNQLLATATADTSVATTT